MKTLFVLPIVFLWVVALLLWSQLASAFTVLHPDGLVDVEQNPNGFNVIDMRTNKITTVTKAPDGYIILPQGEQPTFIMMEPGEEEAIEKDIVIPTILDDDLM